MIDTHCHLWFSDFKGDVPAVIERAKSVGVHTLICVGCDEESSRKSVEIAGQHEHVYAAVGAHPTEGAGSLEWLKKMILEMKWTKKRVVAIGETGLDYYHKPFDRDLQMKMFQEQCLMAQEFDLPVIVHFRSSKESKDFSKSLTSAEQDCLSVLDAVGIKRVLFHCFSGDRTMVDEVLKRGFFISFSGVLTFPRATELREVAKMCPLDRMVVETDSPFLSPESKRGKRNEPAFVVEVAKTIAELKALPYETLEQQLDQNAQMFFSL